MTLSKIFPPPMKKYLIYLWTNLNENEWTLYGSTMVYSKVLALWMFFHVHKQNESHEAAFRMALEVIV